MQKNHVDETYEPHSNGLRRETTIRLADYHFATGSKDAVHFLQYFYWLRQIVNAHNARNNVHGIVLVYNHHIIGLFV